MEGALTADITEEAGVVPPTIDVVYRENLQPDKLCASEIEVLGSHLTELVNELLQLTYETSDELG